MTLQEAKDQVARRYGYEAWSALQIYDNGSAFMDDLIIPQVAELYARAKWSEACEAQKQEIADNGVIALMKRSPEFKP